MFAGDNQGTATVGARTGGDASGHTSGGARRCGAEAKKGAGGLQPQIFWNQEEQCAVCGQIQTSSAFLFASAKGRRSEAANKLLQTWRLQSYGPREGARFHAVWKRRGWSAPDKGSHRLCRPSFAAPES